MNDTSVPKTDTPTLLRQICQALDDKKAGDLKVMRVSEQSSITDYLVLATGTSEPHLRALRVEIEKVIDATGTRILGMDTGESSGWTVIDAVDVMVHVFTAENRSKYSLENLWKDAEEVSLEEVYTGVKPSMKAKAEAAGDKPEKKASKKRPKAVKGAGKSAAAKKPVKKAAAKKTAIKKPAAKKAPKKSAAKKSGTKKARR